MSDPRRRRPCRRPYIDPERLARINELRAGIAARCAYIRAEFPHAGTWANYFDVYGDGRCFDANRHGER